MQDKLQELILYISQKCEDDPKFSDTKLNKILFLADFRAYGYWGRSITGSQYFHNHHGPTSRAMVPARNKLEEAERFHMEERPYFGQKQNRPIATANPNLALFDKEEIELVDQIIEEFWHYTATQLSEETHTYVPWLTTEQGEDIPYETIFVLKKTPASKADMLWAQKVLTEIE